MLTLASAWQCSRVELSQLALLQVVGSERVAGASPLVALCAHARARIGLPGVGARLASVLAVAVCVGLDPAVDASSPAESWTSRSRWRVPGRRLSRWGRDAEGVRRP